MSRLLPLLQLLLLLQRGLAAAPVIKEAEIASWSQQMETLMSDLRANLKLGDMESRYNSAGVKTTAMNALLAKDLLTSVKVSMEKLIARNEMHVQRIREAAETAHAGHENDNFTCSSFTSFPYLRATAITNAATGANSRTVTRVAADQNFCSSPANLSLTPDARLFNLPTNRLLSTAHVPPNIYDASNTILNVAKWSSAVDSVFLSNAKNDSSLKWQFFGSRDGLLKLHPGVQWHKQAKDYMEPDASIDFFDCRQQPWFVMAAAYPKDVIILLDSSGSMKGSRSTIANKTVTDLLETLTANDFFNIIVFRDGTFEYISSDYKRKVLQANEINKIQMLENMTQDEHRSPRELEPKGISNLGVALVEAFELLRMAKNGSLSGSGGVQDIVIITDSSPESHDDVFQKYNADKQIRLFAYLIGHEASDAEIVRTMACNNKGYFSQITTLSDVKENVQRWIPVLARTNALTRDHFFVWTAVHTNQVFTKGISVKENRRLFTSVAQAAYGIVSEQSDTQKTASLIGVAGVDVPAEHFQNLAPAYLLGGLAYAFVINNNGHVLLHPDLRLLDRNGNIRAFHNSKDIADIEWRAGSSNTWPDYNNLPLRVNMINGSDGSLEMERLRTFDGFTHAYRQKYMYFYAPLVSTVTDSSSSLSVGIALPWRNGERQQGKLEYPTKKIAGLTTAELNRLASGFGDAAAGSAASCPRPDVASEKLAVVPDYEFCTFNAELMKRFNINPACALATVLQLSSAEQSQLSCSTTFLRRMLVDIESCIIDGWASFTTTLREQLGVGLAFVWTETGLLKWKQLQTPIDPQFVLLRRNGSREELYMKTALLNSQSPSSAVSLLTPPSSASVASGLAANSSASFPIYFTAPVRLSGTQKSVVAVAGLELSSKKLQEKFISIGSSCTSTGCTNCATLGVRCYIIDSAAIVLASATANELGKAFGDVECAAMSKLIVDRAFEIELAHDYQSTCERREAINSAASTLFNPIKHILNLVSWLFVETALLTAHSLSWLLTSAPASSEGVIVVNTTSYKTEIISGCYSYNIIRVNTATVRPGSTFQSSFTCSSVNATCSTGNCNSNVYMRPVANTNLYFVTVTSDSGSGSCSGCRPTVWSLRKSELMPLQFAFRKIPAWCPSSIDVRDNSTVCGRSQSPPRERLSLFVLSAMLLLQHLVSAAL